MILNPDIRIIDLTLGQFLAAIDERVKTIVNEAIKDHIKELKDEVYVTSLSDVMAELGVSKTTAWKIVHEHPEAVERISPKKSRYNITRLKAEREKIYA